jgi:hypothetical protein
VALAELVDVAPYEEYITGRWEIGERTAHQMIEEWPLAERLNQALGRPHSAAGLDAAAGLYEPLFIRRPWPSFHPPRVPRMRNVDTDEDGWVALAARLREARGQVHGLVKNAGTVRESGKSLAQS